MVCSPSAWSAGSNGANPKAVRGEEALGKQEDLSSVGRRPLSPRGTLRKLFQLVGVEFTKRLLNGLGWGWDFRRNCATRSMEFHPLGVPTPFATASSLPDRSATLRHGHPT